MEKILVSGCLLGKRVRFDGKIKEFKNEILSSWIKEGRVISVCPEVDGGLPTPRIPSEIVSGDGYDVNAKRAKVMNEAGKDVTENFVNGAHKALDIAKKIGVKIAILKSKSPSCSNQKIYDGTYSKTLIDGKGVATALLEKHGIKVFSENEMDEASVFLEAILS